MPFVLSPPAVGTRAGTTSATTSATAYAPGTAPVLPGASVPDWLGDPRDKQADRRFALQEGARRLAGSKALDGCFRRRQFDKETVDLVYYPERQSAGLKGIQTCGSRWACPVCAALLSEMSRRELKAAIDAHEQAVGVGSVVMATFTVPHYERQSCALVLGSQQKKTKDGEANPLYGGLKRALHEFVLGRAGQQLYAEIGITGTVRNLEVTYKSAADGGNGWHCHSHAVWFLDHVPTTAQLQEHWLLARNRWLDSVDKSGLPVASRRALKEHGFVLTGDKQYIEDYMAKMGKETDWHIEHELAKGNVKAGKFGGRTPMQLLADYTVEGDEKAGTAWQEYAATYRGSAQLFWSKGLRKRFGLGKQGTDRAYTDAELLNIQATGQVPDWAKPPVHEVIQDITDRELSKICADGVRGLLLALGRQAGITGDRAAFDLWFAGYRSYDRSAVPLVTQHAAVDPFWEPDPFLDGHQAPPLVLFDVPPHPVQTVAKVKFRLIDHDLDERDIPKTAAQWERENMGRYRDPLLDDPDAWAHWPQLTEKLIVTIRDVDYALRQETGEGLPFLDARRTASANRPLPAPVPALSELQAILAGIWKEVGGKGHVTRSEFNPLPGTPAYDPSLPVHKVLTWSDPGKWAVWRFLVCLHHFAPWLAELAPGDVPLKEEAPPASWQETLHV